MADLVCTRLEREGIDGWEVRIDDMWCCAQPPGYRARTQGWKLHVAATRSSAATVLERSLDVLLRHRCAFKVVRSLELARLLNSAHYPRGGAGKFLTVYPDNDEHFCRLAEELDRATAGLPGPAILSDRPYRAGSLVHYRYGGFESELVLSNDGQYLPMLRGPDGVLVEDRRDAWFTPPAWAPSPFGEPEAAEVADSADPVLLADRFVVREAIRHANKGGVFRATDTRTGAAVVVKQARPYVEANEAGWDVRDALRHEAEMLDLLGPLGVAPRKLELFEQDRDLFLAEELIPGVALRRWVAERGDSGPGVPWSLGLGLARRLAQLLAGVHDAGLALRDLTPNNVIVAEGGKLRVVDLELAARLGTPVVSAGTLGYAAPEQMAGAAAAVEADLYSFGAIIFLLATGTDPVFGDDQPPVRSTHARVEHWLAFASRASEAARRFAPLILGLMDDTPEHRWDLERVQAFLDAEEQALARGTILRTSQPVSGGHRLPPDDQQRLIEDGLAHLIASMAPEDAGWLWPSTCFGANTDACNVHHGAAGVLAVLTLAHRMHGNERLRETLRTACAWIERRLVAEPRLLPGLNFGRSGTAWALYDAARALDDDEMAERALALAKRMPITWPNPDVTHGAAGVGLAQLYLWQATGDTEFGWRVHRCADGLVAAAERRPTGVVWPVSASFDSRFAGVTYYGFAHGVAGIAWFLLAVGLATGRDDCLTLARMAGETLCTAALRDGDSAWWSDGPGNETSRLVYWCHGSSGIGTFLIRLWQATGEERFRTLAEMAAVAVRRAQWQGSSAFCHGLAGNGEFLLDMAAALGEDRYWEWAEELAAVLFARHAYREGRIVVPDETLTGFAADYSGGLAGVLAFVLRLRHGSPRMWMADQATVAIAGATK
jgi:hypothetical protein